MLQGNKQQSLKKILSWPSENFTQGGHWLQKKNLPDPVSSDPGLRPPSLSDAQRTYLGQLGPQQPVLYNYPRNEDIGSHKQKSFCAAWYSQYPFLEYSIEKDAAFCFVCQMFPEGVGREQSEKNWLDTGVRTWHKMKSRGAGKQGKLSQHFSSASHKAALCDYVHFMSTNSRVDVLLDTEIRSKEIQVQEDMQNNRYVIRVILDLCRTMARQGIAFRGSN